MKRQAVSIVKRSPRCGPPHRRGTMLVVLTFMMVLFMVTAAVAINIAKMHLARAELRTATDAAAKAAAEAWSRTQDPDAAIARGSEIAAENHVNGEPLCLRPSDFQFGHSRADRSSGRFVFNPAGRPLNSIRVVGEPYSTSALRPVPLVLGGLFQRAFFEPRQQAVATYIERDIVLVIDRSGSMRGSKFTELQAAIDVFLNTLGTTPVDEQVGLASCSDQATAHVSLTGDLSLVSAALSQLPAEGFTCMSRGLAAGESMMDSGRSRGVVERTMVVISGGQHDRSPDPRRVASELAAAGVVIHAISFGSDADHSCMREIAKIGRGRHFHADDSLELQRIYREIALSLSTMITE